MFRLVSRQIAQLIPRVTTNQLLQKNVMRSIFYSCPKLKSEGSTIFPQQKTTTTTENLMPENEFLGLAKGTLDKIAEQLEALADNPELKLSNDYDVNFSGDVLTLKLGNGKGTYVLNTQTPNRQIWLSSPKSGPRRFDWVTLSGLWVYKHDGSELGRLLSEELTEFLGAKVIIDSNN